MDSLYIKNFIEYLSYIGILNEEGIKQFISNYNSNTDKGQPSLSSSPTAKYASLLESSLSSYLCSLTKLQIKACSKNIITKYTENHQKIKQKYLNVIINLAKAKTIKSSFIKWKSLSSQSSPFFVNHISKPNQTHSIISRKHHQSHQSQNSYKTSSHQESFINRQEKYTQKRKENQNKLCNQNEEDLLLQCTFSPKVISTKDQMSPDLRNKKAVERLLEDSNRRSGLHKANNKNKCNSVSSNFNVFSKKTIEKLYKDAQERDISKKNLQQQIDEERGITFKPISYTKDCGYEVSSEFHDRNKKLIDDRQNFVFVYDYLRQTKFNDNALYKKNQLLIQKANEGSVKELPQE